MFNYHCVIHLDNGNLSAVYRHSEHANDHDAVAQDRAAAIANHAFNDNGIEGSTLIVSGPDTDTNICLDARAYVIVRDEDGYFGAVPE